jgi:branched-chain amino acid transport system permease protein
VKASHMMRRGFFLSSLFAVLAAFFLPFLLSDYYVGLVIQIFVMAIFAASLDILVGHTGLPSMGHAAYFGVAAYATAFLFFAGIKSFWLAAALGALFGGLAAALFGLLALRARGPYFMLITLALSEVLWAIAFKWRSLTGGDDGLPGVKRPEIGLGIDLTSDLHFYYLALALTLVVIVCLFVLLHSPFGYALRGIRESESRMKALGYNVWFYKYLSFIFAGTFGGISGVLWTYYSGFANPSYLGVDRSLKALLMLILGGSGSFFGPVIGATLIVLLENIVSGLTERWSLLLGIVYVVVIMLFSEGITSIVKRGRFG